MVGEILVSLAGRGRVLSLERSFVVALGIVAMTDTIYAPTAAQSGSVRCVCVVSGGLPCTVVQCVWGHQTRRSFDFFFLWLVWDHAESWYSCFTL